MINCHHDVDTTMAFVIVSSTWGRRKLGAHREVIYVEVSQFTTAPVTRVEECCAVQ
jgi:hypothetical protein